MKKRIQAACGEIPPDLVLKGGSVVNVFTCEIIETDVAIYDGFIVGLGNYDGPEMIDARGQYVCPGFIDGHLHIESTMLSPPELARAVIARGTTAVVTDPHEIANVMGKEGIRYILNSTDGLPLDVYVMLPSCVPATDLETSGYELTAEDLIEFKDEPRVLGLGEMMNYPGIVSGVDRLLEKAAAFSGRVMNGHAPLLSGRGLNAYVGAGFRSDHECTAVDEAMEKLRLGMYVMIREGSQERNLKDLLPVVSPVTVNRCMLVSDDLHPNDLLQRGHLDHAIGIAIEQGLDPVLAIRMVTLNTAQYFGLKDLGAVAPGFRADIAVLASLRPVEVNMVFKGGVKILAQGDLDYAFPGAYPVPERFSAMHVRRFRPDAFVMPERGRMVRVIGLVKDQILTRAMTVAAMIDNGVVAADPQQDILKLAVVERHRSTGNIGLGLVHGFGLAQGALASSVSHDSHNITCAGCSDEDLYAAVKAVEEMKGGLAVTAGGRVLAQLALPIGGLMSDRPLSEIAALWEDARRAARGLGCALEDPFMALSFLALPVIPELRLTDRGLVDVELFKHVPLFVS